jgi:hypothetical protein
MVLVTRWTSERTGFSCVDALRSARVGFAHTRVAKRQNIGAELRAEGYTRR